MSLLDIWQALGSSQIAEITALMSTASSSYRAQRSSDDLKKCEMYACRFFKKLLVWREKEQCLI